MVEAAVALALIVCAGFSLWCYCEVCRLRRELWELWEGLRELLVSEMLARAAAKEMATELLKIGGVPLGGWKVWLN